VTSFGLPDNDRRRLPRANRPTHRRMVDAHLPPLPADPTDVAIALLEQAVAAILERDELRTQVEQGEIRISQLLSYIASTQGQVDRLNSEIGNQRFSLYELRRAVAELHANRREGYEPSIHVQRIILRIADQITP